MATSRKFNFTQKAIEALPAHDRESKSTWQEYTDLAVKGLKLMVGKGGNKVFYFRYSFNRRKRGLKIGTFGAFGVKQARQKAMEFTLAVESGIDPFAERQKVVQALTFGEFCEQHYFPHIKEHLKSWKTPHSIVTSGLFKAWKKFPLSAISTRDVQTYITNLKKRVSAGTCNRHLAVISKIFSLAIEWQFLEGENICKPIKKLKDNNIREVFLPMADIMRFIKKLNEAENLHNACALQLLAVTGMRKGECLVIEHKHVDVENKMIHLQADNTKSGKGRKVPLNPIALGIVEKLLANKIPGNRYLFPSPRKEGEAIQEIKRTFKWAKAELNLDPKLRIHDLRHSWASALAQSEVPLYEIQQILGHATPDMTMRYAHLTNKTLQEASNKTAELLAKAQ